MNHKSFLSWSGGKDSSLCLYKAKKQGIKVEALLTSVNKHHGRISMHGVRRALLEQQAAALGLPLYTAELPEQPDMQEYERVISDAYQQLKRDGFDQVLFGDIFLEDLKQYREQQMAKEGIQPLFPLWKKDSRELMEEFISAGFKGIIVCVNKHYLPEEFCGRLIDASFVRDLPAGVDVCGENGEYHSFVFDGPIFQHPVPFELGDQVHREYRAPSEENTDCFTEPRESVGFAFCDLLPVER